MEGKKVICLCLLAIVSLQTIQQISATKRLLLRSIINELRPSNCQSTSGFINGNTGPLPSTNFDIIAELLYIRRLLEQGYQVFGSTTCLPLSPSIGSSIDSPLSGSLGSSLGGPSGSPLSGPLGSNMNEPLNGPLSLPSLGAGLSNYAPNLMRRPLAGLLHN